MSSSPTALVCSICGNDKIITDSESGEMICKKCGQVISDRIQETLPEWRNFPDTDESKNRNRTGMSASLARHDMGLSTTIGRSDKDASGHALDAVMRTTMARLRTWDSRSQFHTSTDRNLQHAFDQLYALKDKLGLSDAVLEKTAYIYRKAQDKRLVRGRTISAILIAAVYAAYRETGIARTLKDLSTASNIKRKDIARSYMLIATELDLKVPVIDPVKYVAKIANKAGLSEKTKRKAIGIMNDVIKRKISDGKSPMGLAGSVLYLACLVTGETKSQSDIAHAADITEVTIRNRFKDLKNNFHLNSNQ